MFAKILKLNFVVILLLLINLQFSYSYDYIIQSLRSIILRSSLIAHGNVSEILIEKDDTGTPQRVVKIEIIAKIWGNYDDDIVILKMPILDYEDPNQPLTPWFIPNEEVIVHLGYDNIKNIWFPLGHDQGKFAISNKYVEGSTIDVSTFKQQIQDVAKSKISHIFSPPRNISKGYYRDGEGEGTPKLDGEFHLLDSPFRYGPTSGIITFFINPTNARDKDDNPISFSTLKSCLERAINSWNNVPHSYATFTIFPYAYYGSRGNNNGVSTITFEFYTSNAAADVFEDNGIIDEVDLIFDRKNRWNTDVTYPSSYEEYYNSNYGYIGPVDLEDVAAHELGHGVGLHHVDSTKSTYTLYATIYEEDEWWEKTHRRSLENGDKAGKIYQDPSIPDGVSTQQIPKMLLCHPPTFTLEGNFTVGSGKSLEIEAGKTMKGNSSKKMTINGTLKAIGTSSNRITFQKSGSSNWYGLEFSNASNQSKVKYCTIKDATYGIYMYNSDIAIEYNDIYDIQSSFLYFTNGSDGYGTISYNEIHDGADDPIEFYSYSDPSFRYNEVYDTDGDSFSGNSTCCFWLGGYTTYGNNAIYNSGDMDVASYYSGTIYAENNWWGSSSPNPWVSWNVDWTPYLTSNPLAKPIARPHEDMSNQNEFDTEQDLVGMPEVDEASLIYFDGKYDEASILFENLANKYPNHFAGKRSLAFLYKCYKKSKSSDLVLLKLAEYAAKSDYKELSTLAQHFMVGELIKNGDYQEAIETSESILSEQKDSDCAQYALYNLGSIYYYYLEDKETGETYFREYLEKYPEDVLTSSVLSTLEEPLPEVYNSVETGDIAVDVFGNYPNPFNPKTTITYFVNKPGKFTLKVYNILGEKVQVLVDEYKETGRYEVIFDGSRLSSGTYFYSIASDDFNAVKKMLLLRYS